MKKKNQVQNMVITALFAALIAVATLVIHIPTPGTNGYVNLGDGFILICAFTMPPLYAGIAGGLGSALADLVMGYLPYSPGTLVIKGLMGLLAGLLYMRFGKGKPIKVSLPVMIVAGIAAECVMVLGYFFYEAVILGFGVAAAASIPANIGQGAMGVAVACVAVPILQRNNELKSLLDKTWK